MFRAISSSNRPLKWECFINLYCWAPWDLFFEANQLSSGRSGWEGWIELCHCSWHRSSVLDWLCCLWNQTENRSWCKARFSNHYPLSEGIDSLNASSVTEKKTVNSFALLLLTGNELCETQRKGVTSLWLWHGSKVELHVGMKPCLIRFCNYFDTILAEACWVKQFLV